MATLCFPFPSLTWIRLRLSSHPALLVARLVMEGRPPLCLVLPTTDQNFCPRSAGRKVTDGADPAWQSSSHWSYPSARLDFRAGSVALHDTMELVDWHSYWPVDRGYELAIYPPATGRPRFAYKNPLTFLQVSSPPSSFLITHPQTRKTHPAPEVTSIPSAIPGLVLDHTRSLIHPSCPPPRWPPNIPNIPVIPPAMLLPTRPSPSPCRRPRPQPTPIPFPGPCLHQHYPTPPRRMVRVVHPAALTREDPATPLVRGASATMTLTGRRAGSTWLRC